MMKITKIIGLLLLVGIVLYVIRAQMFFPTEYTSEVLFHDTFDDNDPEIITNGVGSEWGVFEFKKGSIEEQNGQAKFTVAADHGSMWLWANDPNEFQVLTPDTLALTYVIDSTVIQTSHVYDRPWAFHWDIGVISANYPNKPFTHPPKIKGVGGLYFRIAYKDSISPAKFTVLVADDQVDLEAGEHEGPGFSTLFSAWFQSYNGHQPITCQLFLSEGGWKMELSETFEDGTTICEGTWAMNEVFLDEELENGVFLSLIGRNSGTGNSGAISERPNYSYLSEVMVERKKQKLSN